MRLILLISFAIFASSVLAASAQGSGSGSLATGTGIFRQIPFTTIVASNATGTLTLSSDGSFTIYSDGLVNFVVSPTGTWTVQAGGSTNKAQLVLRSTTGTAISIWNYTTLSGNFANVGSFSKSLTAGSYYFAFGASTAKKRDDENHNVNRQFGRTSSVTNFGVTISKTI